MKNKRLFTLILLFLMSFQVLHAYVIDALDTHSCHVGEYVQEFSQNIQTVADNDVCQIHHAFHISFIIPDTLVLNRTQNSAQKPSSSTLKYEYSSYDDFLRPPITL